MLKSPTFQVAFVAMSKAEYTFEDKKHSWVDAFQCFSRFGIAAGISRDLFETEIVKVTSVTSRQVLLTWELKVSSVTWNPIKAIKTSRLRQLLKL